MNGNELPDEDNVVRYARFTDFTDLEAGTLNCSAFQLRPNETGLSVNWLEYFRDLDKSRQLDKVRQLIQLDLSRNGRLAELNVGATVQYVSDRLPGIRFVHSPAPPKGQYPSDPSHSDIVGLPANWTPESELIGDLIAECFAALHPARL
jgi:hypothetical protein